MVLGYQGNYSAAKMSDFIRIERVLKNLFYAYCTYSDSFSIVLYDRIFYVELSILPEKGLQHYNSY